MLTKFMMPYPVARSDGRAIWQRMGMLLPSKNPQPRPKMMRKTTATQSMPVSGA